VHGEVMVAISNANYAQPGGMLDTWAECVLRAGVKNALVVALDEPTKAHAETKGLPAFQMTLEVGHAAGGLRGGVRGEVWGLQRRAWWPGGLPAASRSSRRAAGGAVWGVLFMPDGEPGSAYTDGNGHLPSPLELQHIDVIQEMAFSRVMDVVTVRHKKRTLTQHDWIAPVGRDAC